MRAVKHLILIFLVASALPLVAQKSIRKQADKLYEVGNYREALKLYTQLKTDNLDIVEKMGICSFNLIQPKDCISQMELLEKKFDEVESYRFLKYLADSYVMISDYKRAAAYYKQYLNLGNLKAVETANIINKIKQCEYGIKLSYLDAKAYVENFGAAVNSPYDDIKPIQNPQFLNKYYFSSNRDIAIGGPKNSKGLVDNESDNYYYDMFGAEIVNGQWTPVYPFNTLQNTPSHEIALDFSKDGNSILFSRQPYDLPVEIYCDTLDAKVEDRAFSAPIADLPFQPKLGDKDLFIFNDSTYFFSSQRFSGFGGYDLFFVIKSNGIWSEPKNLGNVINSSFNEVSPFITKGSKQLFFSSDRITSLGGYDVFQTSFDANKHNWSPIENMALPINSAGDDLDFRVSLDGNQAVLSSNRIKGNGGFDLYLVYLKNQNLDQLSYVDFPIFIDSIYNQTPIVMEESPITEHKAVVVEKKNAVIQNTLFFTDDQNLLAPYNKTALQNILDIMTIFPMVGVTFTANSTMEMNADISLFFTMKRGEKIRDYLIEKGIKAERINLISNGSSNPMILNETNSGLSNRLNNRIEVRLENVDTSKLNVVYDEAKVSENVVHPEFYSRKSLQNSLSFKIKVGETAQMIKNEALKQYDYLSSYYKSGGIYDYFVGQEYTYSAARTLRNKLLENQFVEAKIVPFYKDLPIDATTMEQLRLQYSELQEYINYEK